MLAIVYEARLRPEEHRRAEIVEAQWAKVARALDAIEARWMAYLAGPFDAGQIALGCCPRLRRPARRRPRLARRPPGPRRLGGAGRRSGRRWRRHGRPEPACVRPGADLFRGTETEGRSMDKFTKLTGVAAPLPLINVDTDMIIPKQFLKTIQRSGLGKNLFDEMRYDAGRQRGRGLRAEPAGLPQGDDPRRRRELRLRLVARARALGAARLRHPLRDRAELRRHLLQQLLQERHPADRAAAGGGRQADGRRRARRQRRRHRSTSRTR